MEPIKKQISSQEKICEQVPITRDLQVSIQITIHLQRKEQQQGQEAASKFSKFR